MNSEISERLKTLVARNQLSPEEIDELADMTLAGYFGNGSERKYSLGKWYIIIQPLVNSKVARSSRIPQITLLCRARTQIRKLCDRI